MSTATIPVDTKAASWWWEELEGDRVTADELNSDPQLRQVAAGRLLLLRRGRHRRTPTASSGSGVRLAQRALLMLGFSLPRAGADGQFGPETETAVRAFQRSAGVAADGVIGALTLAALVRTIASRQPRPPAPRPAGNPVADYWRRRLRIGLNGNTVEPLIDGPAAFSAIHRAMTTAVSEEHFIYLLGWWCDPWTNLAGAGTCLLDTFARAGRQGVQVRGLIWASSSVAYPNHARLARAAVDAANRLPNVHPQVDDPPGLTKSHHQKLVVVKGGQGLIALQGGVDVNVDRV